MKRKEQAVVKEPPQLLCARCRQWKVSDEACEMLAGRNDVKTTPRAWICPPCRGEEIPAPVAVPPPTGADIVRGRRDVVAVVRKTASGKSVRARLECGHEMTVLAGAKHGYCRKCLRASR